MTDTNTRTTCATANGKSNKIILFLLILGGLIGFAFFLKNWDRPITDATIFCAILVELPIQYLISKYKNVTI